MCRAAGADLFAYDKQHAATITDSAQALTQLDAVNADAMALNKSLSALVSHAAVAVAKVRELDSVHMRLQKVRLFGRAK
jgi:hypothetical protein